MKFLLVIIALLVGIGIGQSLVNNGTDLRPVREVKVKAVTPDERKAFKRLSAWSNPNAVGSPTQRMVTIWPNPHEMARDIHVLLAKVQG